MCGIFGCQVYTLYCIVNKPVSLGCLPAVVVLDLGRGFSQDEKKKAIQLQITSRLETTFLALLSSVHCVNYKVLWQCKMEGSVFYGRLRCRVYVLLNTKAVR